MNNFQWMQKLRSIISVKKKRAGFMLADVIITGTLLAGLAVGFAGLFSSSFVSWGNMRTGLQTQAIAQAKSSQIIAQGYSSMADEPRAAVTGTNFEREVVLGTPVDLGSGAFQRTATINVYKPSESTPRMSLDVPLSSQGSSSAIPQGTILPWWGNLDSIPSGYLYCDGANGTPDLRGRSIFGSGLYNADGYGLTNYIIGQTGGERMHKLSISEIPSHTHVQNIPVDGAGTNADNPSLSGSPNADEPFMPVGKTFSAGNDQPHNNMPPYTIVHWIMKR